MRVLVIPHQLSAPTSRNIQGHPTLSFDNMGHTQPSTHHFFQQRLRCGLTIGSPPCLSTASAQSEATASSSRGPLFTPTSGASFPDGKVCRELLNSSPQLTPCCPSPTRLSGEDGVRSVSLVRLAARSGTPDGGGYGSRCCAYVWAGLMIYRMGLDCRSYLLPSAKLWLSGSTKRSQGILSSQLMHWPPEDPDIPPF